MRRLFIPVVALGMVISGASFAQSSSSTPQPGSQAATPPATQQGSPVSQLALLTPQTLKQDLQNAGFTDVNVTPESFLVQARTKDGHPVVMTIGPHGFTAMEAIDRTAPASTGSISNSGTDGSGSQN